MRSLVALVLVCLGAVAACDGDPPATNSTATPSPSPANPAAEDIIETFDSYKQAVIDEDGTAAVQHLSVETIAYYEGLRTLALEADKSELQDVTLIDRLGALLLRHVLPAEELHAMTGEEVVSVAISQGLTGQAEVAEQELGEVTIQGTAATAAVTVSGRPAPFEYTLRQQDGAWKIDLQPLIVASNSVFQELAVESDLTENQFVIEVLSSVSGSRPPKSIWDPPTIPDTG